MSRAERRSSATSSVTEHTLRANGLAFHLAEAGDGPPVLLHGSPDSWRLWRHQIPALAEAGHRVIAPDLRGFGETDRPAAVEDYKLRTLVNDVVGLLEELDVDRAAVVSHDWGAALAWAVARFVPDRLSRLVVVSVGHPLANAAAGLAQRQLSWYMLWFLFPGVAERVLPEGDWGVFRRWTWNGARRGEDPDLDRQLADLSRFALTEAQMTSSGRFVSGPWCYERLDGVDHGCQVHAPDRLNELLVDFLG